MFNDLFIESNIPTHDVEINIAVQLRPDISHKPTERERERERAPASFEDLSNKFQVMRMMRCSEYY
jgi:hypothetical protein